VEIQKKIHVLAVVNGLGYGGTERMLERLVRALTSSGEAQFTVCSLSDEGPIGRELRSSGIEVVSLGARGGTAGIILRGILGVRRLLRKRRFDVIHSFLYRSHCAARIGRLGSRPRVPLISSERCLGDNRLSTTLLVNRLTSRMSDMVVAVSGAVRDRVLQRDRIPPARVVVVANGIEPARANPDAGADLRRRLGISPSEIVFLFLGRLHAEKGPDLLLNALGRLSVRGTARWRALVVGSGPEEENLKRTADNLGIRDRLIFAGPHRHVGNWIDASDLLVLPSREEGMPVAALEAMSYGKPVIATRVGGTPEVVKEEETGLLVPPEDPEALSTALDRMSRDAEMRATMGRRGMMLVRSEFSLDRMAGEYLSLYRTVVQQQPGAVLADRKNDPVRASGR
jgi:glycosyltransferase involved in cell wall biosynthesis